jgi:hypothetical protein
MINALAPSCAALNKSRRTTLIMQVLHARKQHMTASHLFKQEAGTIPAKSGKTLKGNVRRIPPNQQWMHVSLMLPNSAKSCLLLGTEPDLPVFQIETCKLWDTDSFVPDKLLALHEELCNIQTNENFSSKKQQPSTN